MKETKFILCLIGLVATILLVGAYLDGLPDRDAAQLNGIYNNLKTIEMCKEEWVLEHKSPPGTEVPLTNLLKYTHGGPEKNLILGEVYLPGKIGEPATAVLPHGIKLKGKAGPFTISDF